MTARAFVPSRPLPTRLQGPTPAHARRRPSAAAAVLAAVAAMAVWLAVQPVRAQGPSFDCAKVPPGGIDRLICDDRDLSALDRKLADVYAAAAAKATNEHPPTLRAEQIGWIRGRGDCWKADDKRACVRTEYVRRIAELQARYRLVRGTGPVFYHCDGDRRNEVVATFFPTDPPTLIAERGDSVSLMYRQPGGSGVKYLGRNESLEGEGDDVSIAWGYGAPKMACRKAP
jgi:uncharacterized protein